MKEQSKELEPKNPKQNILDSIGKDLFVAYDKHNLTPDRFATEIDTLLKEQGTKLKATQMLGEALGAFHTGTGIGNQAVNVIINQQNNYLSPVVKAVIENHLRMLRGGVGSDRDEGVVDVKAIPLFEEHAEGE